MEEYFFIMCRERLVSFMMLSRAKYSLCVCVCLSVFVSEQVLSDDSTITSLELKRGLAL